MTRTQILEIATQAANEILVESALAGATVDQVWVEQAVVAKVLKRLEELLAKAK